MSLREFPQFRAIWLSSFAAYVGLWSQTVALGWLVLQVTHSTFYLAVFTAFRLAPMLVGPVGGVLADKVDRTSLLAASQFIASIVIAAALVLFHWDLLNFWIIVVSGFLTGLTGPPLEPARLTMIADIVEPGYLQNAMAINTVCLFASIIISPIISGLLIDISGITSALLFATLMFLASAVILANLGPIERHLPSSTSLNQHATAFNQFLQSSRLILTNGTTAAVLLVSFCANILVFPAYQAFMPVFAKDVLHSGAGGLGLLLTSSGLGAVIGSFFISVLGEKVSKGKLFLGSTAVYGLLFAIFALSRSLLLSVLLMAAVGFASAGFAVLQNSLMLTLAPAEIRGQAMGLQVLAIGILPIAILFQGAVASEVGVVATTTLGGCLLAVCMGVILVRCSGLASVE